MSQHRNPSISRRLILPAIVLALALAGCGASTSGRPKTTLSSTPTVTAPATATSHQQAPADCTGNGGAPLTIQKLQVGRAGAIDDGTWEWLPDNLPLTPQAVSSITPVALGTLGAAMTIGVDVNAPPASQPGYVCGVTVRIVSFQPLSGSAANVYHQCVDQYYMDPGGFMPSTACPASGVPAGVGDVVFPSSSVGAEATGSITLAPFGNQTPTPNQPAQEPPSSEPNGAGPTDLVVNVHVPQPGTYTFAVSLWQDRSGPSVTGPNVTVMFLFGKATREWGGQPCTDQAMRAQLPPATNPPTQVICPGGAPTVQ
jgi:hypothetical protein